MSVRISSLNHLHISFQCNSFDMFQQTGPVKSSTKIKKPSWVIKLNGILYEDFDTRFASH